MKEAKKLIPILKIVSTHGLKGEVKALPLTNNFKFILAVKKFYPQPNPKEPLEVESIRLGPGEKFFLVKFKKIDFHSANSLINSTLYISEEELPTSSEEEVYVYELEGLKVVDKEGKFWGEVSEVMPLGEYNLLRVKSEDLDFYLPLVAEYVEEIDLASGKILVKEISSLAELGKSKKK